jgi:integrase
MASISFLLQSTKKPASIYVRVRDSNFDAKAKTDLLIDPDNWSSAKKQPKNIKDAEGKKIKSDLDEIYSIILKGLNTKDAFTTIDSTWIYETLNPKNNKEEYKTILEYFDIYLNFKKSKKAKSSMISKINVVKKLVYDFEKQRKRTILLIDFDLKMTEEFVDYMTSNNYRQSYIFRVVKFIKTVCRHARDSGLKTSPNLDSIKTEDSETSKIYLTLEEIEKIKLVNLTTDGLTNARDWLVISCYLGQRVSDLMRCSKDKIKKIGNHYAIDLTQKKTQKPILVAITPEVELELKKRNGDFPRSISAQRYNEHIKEVCKIAGLTNKVHGILYDKETNRDIDGEYEKWQLITSHVGRRSFATNYYGKYPTAFLMSQTGHTTERAFLEYIGKGRMDFISQFLDMVHSNVVKS